MKDEEPQEGIIGFFDILGYQSFLQNNSAEYAAKEVLGTLTNLDEQIPSLVAKAIEERTIPSWVSGTKWLIFSDTILLTSSLSEIEKDIMKITRWMGFVMTCLSLNTHMFKFGLCSKVT